MESQEQIDRIVREVIQRLTAQVNLTSPNTLRIDQRVITLATIEGKLNGVKVVIVPPNAVITPSVRDELTSRHIQLHKRSDPELAPTLVVANLAQTDVRQAIAGVNCDVATISENSDRAVIARLARLLAPNVLGVVFSDRPEETVHLANRNSRIRAFWGASQRSIHRAMMTMDPNLMILEAALDPSDSVQRMNCFTAREQGPPGHAYRIHHR